jgi:tRNA(fMet)-specific endonuclease VapC
MTRFILDTDHVSLWLQGNPSICAKTAGISLDIAVTIVTVQELFNGWVVQINNPALQEKSLSLLYMLY